MTFNRTMHPAAVPPESPAEVIITFGIAIWAAVMLFLVTGSWLPALIFLALVPPAEVVHR